MRLIKKYLSLLILFMSSLFAQNNYPIVLVHGFLGWGPEEMVGYKYWGGFWDAKKLLLCQVFTF